MATVLIDLQTAFAVGVLFALVAKVQIETEQVGHFSRYVRTGFLFGIVYGLAVGAWCVEYPDWMWGYAVPASEWSLLWWYPGFVLALGIAGAAGSWLAQLFIARGRFWMALGVGLLGVWLLVSVWAMSFEEYMNLSTYADWHATPRGPTQPTNQDAKWVTGSLIVTVVMVVFSFWFIVGYVREGLKLSRLRRS